MCAGWTMQYQRSSAECAGRNRWEVRWADIWREIDDRYIGRQTETQTDRQTDRRTDGQTDRQAKLRSMHAHRHQDKQNEAHMRRFTCSCISSRDNLSPHGIPLLLGVLSPPKTSALPACTDEETLVYRGTFAHMSRRV